MAANVPITCEKCGKTFNLRFDPGPDNWAVGAAKRQLDQECPNHEGGWRFWGHDQEPSDSKPSGN